MQIMPTSSASSVFSDNLFADSTTTRGSDSSFAAEMARQQEARDAVNNGEAHSVQAALGEDDTPKVTPLNQAPYNLTSTNGVTYTVDEVIFTKEELKKLESDLKANGAPIDSLNEIKKLVQQPDGSTLGEVMAAANSLREYPTLSSKEAQSLKGLSNKIDSSGNLYSAISGHLADGDGQGALNALVQAVQGNGVQVTREEMVALTKALGLDDATKQQIMGQFGESNTLTLNQAGMKGFMTPAYNDYAEEASDREKVAKALDAALGEVLQKAKDRMAAEKAASELSSRTAEQSKVLIEETVLEKVNSNLEGTRAAQEHLNTQTAEKGKRLTVEANATNANAKSHTQAENAKTNELVQAQVNAGNMATALQTASVPVREKVQTSTMHDTEALHATTDAHEMAEKLVPQAVLVDSNGKPIGEAKNTLDAQNLNQEQSLLHAQDADIHDSNTRDNRDARNESKNDAWSQIFTKTDVRTDVPADVRTSDPRTINVSSTNTLTTPVLGIGGLVQPQNTAQSMFNQGQVGRQGLSQQAAAQVEQAMLTAAKDGSKSIELQLHPAELGALTITLTARNGEVSAMIRSEKTETAEMLNQQIDQLRMQLENQGIKIDKMEVRTGSENASTHDSWQGMDQHNAHQEENARREMFERMRNLATVRNSNTSSENAPLERNMQGDSNTAGNAAQSLYVVA